MSFMTPIGMLCGGGGASVVPTTFNPADKSANITLSNSNATAVSSGNGGARAVKGQPSTTANHYFEIKIEAFSGSFNQIGIAISSVGLTSPPGTSGFVYAANGNVFGGSGYAASTWSNGAVIGVYLKAGNVYFSLGGAWQNSANPANGTGGLAVGNFLYYPIAYLSVAGNQFTINAIPTHLPSGALAWG